MRRYASIWFPFLLTDYICRKNPDMRNSAFVLSIPDHGRMLVKAANSLALGKGIKPGMVIADCKAVHPELHVLESEPDRERKLLSALAEWCIGYTPVSAVDFPDGLMLDITGCAHLWGGEASYLQSIKSKLNAFGYEVRTAVSDTIGAAWAAARFKKDDLIIKPGHHPQMILNLPPAALRLEENTLARLKKLGLNRIGDFINMPRAALRRRFGQLLPERVDQALGKAIELLTPVKPIEPYRESLPSMEPICTPTGITIALNQLLETICKRFEQEGVGLRSGIFKAYRVDGDIQQVTIGTGHPSRNPKHLFRLFENKIDAFEPALGFELFLFEAQKVEPAINDQGVMWDTSCRNDTKIAELLDRITSRPGKNIVMRYLPTEHYWPERSTRGVTSLKDKSPVKWRTDLPRPIRLLSPPKAIEVTAPVPDYPPMLFRFEGKLHQTAKADGPERIEQEWWLENGTYRDYYCVEDQSGMRFWIFRAGPYDQDSPDWFLHGFFA